MATVITRTPKALTARVPRLQNGDRLTRDEFERRYAAMPRSIKAELIQGVVYVASPVSAEHASPHFDLITWLGVYRALTPGVAGLDNATLRLDDENEPQPDAFLRVPRECGGQSNIDDEGYVIGGPEFVAEVAASSASYDLHDKLETYRQHRVQEYLVWRVWDHALDWFLLRRARYTRLEQTTDGNYRSHVFPGLWLDPAALIRGDMAAVMRVVQQGIASPEHAAFVARLQRAAARRRS